MQHGLSVHRSFPTHKSNQATTAVSSDIQSQDQTRLSLIFKETRAFFHVHLSHMYFPQNSFSKRSDRQKETHAATTGYEVVRSYLLPLSLTRSLRSLVQTLHMVLESLYMFLTTTTVTIPLTTIFFNRIIQFFTPD